MGPLNSGSEAGGSGALRTGWILRGHHKVVAVIPAVPVARAVRPLVNRPIEWVKRHQSVSADEAPPIVQALQEAKDVGHRMTVQMPGLAFEYNERPMALQQVLAA